MMSNAPRDAAAEGASGDPDPRALIDAVIGPGEAHAVYETDLGRAYLNRMPEGMSVSLLTPPPEPVHEDFFVLSDGRLRAAYAMRMPQMDAGGARAAVPAVSVPPPFEPVEILRALQGAKKIASEPMNGKPLDAPLGRGR